MNQMDGKHRDESLYRRRCQYSSSDHHDRLNNENPLYSSNGQSKSMTYSYFPAKTSVVPLILNKTLPSSNAIPRERESWIRSVKRTKINEGAEQKTQYLETMLRMQSWIRSVEKNKTNESTKQQAEYLETILHTPQQQKSSTDSANFDRIRFADQQIPTTENNNNDDEINVIETILLDNEVQSNIKPTSNQASNSGSTLFTDTDPSRWSGFLIDNCDEVESSPASPPLPPLPSNSSIEDLVQQNQEDLNKRHAMLVNEFNTVDVEQSQKLKRQKQLNKKLQKKKQQQPKKTKPTVKKNNHQELPSDWIVEYDAIENDQISQLIKKTSTAMTVEDKVTNINIILEKIKKQQMDIKKLRQHVLSMLNEEPKLNSINTNEQNSSNGQDLLMKVLNQSMISECWLCSGKTYTEVATQCNNIDEQ